MRPGHPIAILGTALLLAIPTRPLNGSQTVWRVAVSGGASVAPDRSSQLRPTYSVRLLAGRTHAVGLEASVFHLGAVSSDGISPLYTVGEPASTTDSARYLLRESTTLLSFLPTYSYRLTVGGIPLATYLSAGVSVIRSHIDRQVTPLDGSPPFARSSSSVSAALLTRGGIGLGIPGLNSAVQPQLGVNVFGLDSLFDPKLLISVTLGLVF